MIRCVRVRRRAASRSRTTRRPAAPDAGRVQARVRAKVSRPVQERVKVWGQDPVQARDPAPAVAVDPGDDDNTQSARSVLPSGR